MRKALAVLIALLLLAAAGAYYYFSGKEYVFRFTESQLQEKLDSKLPLTRTYFLLFNVTLDQPRVSLSDGPGRVKAGLDIHLNLRVNNERSPLGGSIDVTSGVRYDPEQGAFFLTDPVVDQLAVQGIPAQYAQQARIAITRAVAAYYSEYPIYSLQGTDLKQMAARLVLKDVVVENQTLIVTLGI